MRQNCARPEFRGWQTPKPNISGANLSHCIRNFSLTTLQLEQENRQLECELQQKVNSTDAANERVMEILDYIDAVSILENLISLLILSTGLSNMARFAT
jgi:hypothetical protein